MKPMSVKRLLHTLLLLSILALTACGFQMRGYADLSFKTLLIEGNISILRDLKKSLLVNGVKVVSEKEDAELMLDLMNEVTEKRILSLSGTGVVREFDLIYKVTYRVKQPNEELWGEPKVIETRRDFSYSDREVLATGYEEQRLNTEMRQETTQQLVRSLVAYKVNK
jgi:LPS-assembly lipoprotein